LYLELGKLAQGKIYKSGKRGNPRGEITIYMGFDWVVKEAGSVIGGSKNSKLEYKSLASKLMNTSILDAVLAAGSNNLQVQFENDLTFITSELTKSEQDWSISFNTPYFGHLSIENGVFHISKNS
jgi:hypothetical protein